MAKEKESKDEGFFIELQRDLGYRGVHLGKGFVLDCSGDLQEWGEYMCLTPTDAKRVPKPDTPPPKPWENLAPLPPTPPAGKHPTEPRAYADATPKHR